MLGFIKSFINGNLNPKLARGLKQQLIFKKYKWDFTSYTFTDKTLPFSLSIFSFALFSSKHRLWAQELPRRQSMH